MSTLDSPVRILDFTASLAEHFYRLNAEWLRRYFTMEPVDEAILSNPVKHIIEPGGSILFAERQSEIVGTCALIREHPESSRFELAKMGVTSNVQGLGIGRRLIKSALARYHAFRGRQLYLETNSGLTPAIRLYESVGFEHHPHPNGASSYQRADVYMVYAPRDAT